MWRTSDWDSFIWLFSHSWRSETGDWEHFIKKKKNTSWRWGGGEVRDAMKWTFKGQKQSVLLKENFDIWCKNSNLMQMIWRHVSVLTEAWDLLTVWFLFLVFVTFGFKMLLLLLLLQHFSRAELYNSCRMHWHLHAKIMSMCSYSREEAALQHQWPDQRTRSSDP